MSKIRLSKRGLALLVASGLTLGTTGMVISSLNKKDPKKEENSIGYEDINSIINFNVDEEDFVVLNIGDHDQVGVHFQNRKMKYCNKKDISLGVVISTNSTTEDAIYDDVEYVKGILSDYEVDFPVYLNIDEIITNDDLNVEMKTKLIKDFLEKCSSNNIYVGIYGTDTNLCRVKKYCDITDYDAFLVMDNKEILYDGSYNVYKDLDGNIKSKTDLAKVIKENNFNSKDEFVNDGAYIVNKDDDITDVALKYGMSVNELLKFNEISKKDVEVGTVLRIPMVIGKVAPTGSGEYEKVEEPLRGCDMSYCQGNSPDWDILKENFEFIILKCSQGLELDDCFETYALNCKQNNIPIGVYCYNQYTLNNCSDIEVFNKNQQFQVEFALQTLKNKKIDYPVYFDIEGNVRANLSEDYVKSMLDIWVKNVSSAGYIPGIYCNQDGFRYLQECVDYPLSEKFEIWIAGGKQYGDETRTEDNIEFKNVVASDVLDDQEFNATMAQSTNVAINAGAGDSRGHLDINFCTVDYTKETPLEDSKTTDTQFAIKEFRRIDYPLVGGAVGIALAGITGAIGVVNYNSKGKVKRRVRR